MLRFGFQFSEVVLSCDLPDINIFTDNEYLDVSISVHGSAIFESRYYTLNKVVTVTDVSSIVEEYLEKVTGNNFAVFTVTAAHGEDTASKTFCSMFCRMSLRLDSEQWLQENFLTLAPVRRVAPESVLPLYWYTKANDPMNLHISATFFNENGERDTFRTLYPENSLKATEEGVLSDMVPLADVVDTIKKSKKCEEVKLLSVTVRRGSRSITFFIDEALSGILPLWYTNCFNIPEPMVFCREEKRKLSVERSTAVLGKRSQFYDVARTMAYELQSEPLTKDECQQAEQLFMASDVRVIDKNYSDLYDTDFEAMVPIMITDFTCEISDSDSELNQVKLTWEYADRKIVSLDAKLSPGIFNNVYNPAFN